jgi:hypothetical protein
MAGGCGRLAWPSFDPNRGFGSDAVDPCRGHADLGRLDAALAAASALLGSRLRDLTYRAAVAYLSAHPECQVEPATQPPARWWLIERDPDETPAVAYEDADGMWWEYEPATGRLHNHSWLFTDYYYNLGKHGLRFSPLSAAGAREAIAARKGPVSPRELVSFRAADVDAMDPGAVLGDRFGRQ